MNLAIQNGYCAFAETDRQALVAVAVRENLNDLGRDLAIAYLEACLNLLPSV